MELQVEPKIVPAGKLKPGIVPGASKPVTIYPSEIEVPLSTEAATSPRFVSEIEQEWYTKIHGLQASTLKKLKSAWDDFKTEFLDTLEKKVDSDQKELFDSLLTDFNDIASKAFPQAVLLGNAYYEDQFQVNGIGKKQRQEVANKHLEIFKDKAENLFKDDVIMRLDDSPLLQFTKVLNGFDRFLIGYANVVAAVAYDVFARNIQLLNLDLFRRFSIAGIEAPKDIVKVVWVLDPDAKHSDDCWNLAENGQYGPGIWDARYLTDNNLVPRSPSLDCGGNCKCHLSPLVPLDPPQAAWLNKIVALPEPKNVLNMVPNMSRPEFLALFKEKQFNIPLLIQDVLAEQKALRRKELWQSLPRFEFITKVGPRFRVDGQTDLLKKTFGIGRIQVQVTFGPGETFATLTAAQKQQIIFTVAHELGHTLTNNAVGGDVIVGIFGGKPARILHAAAQRERELALGQIKVNFDNAVEHIAKGSLTPEMRRDIEVMNIFMADSDKFLKDLFESVRMGGQFGGVPARQAWEIFEALLRQYSPGTLLTRGYQLWDIDEFFADWFALLLTSPEKAATFSPLLTKAVAEALPKGFFDSVVIRRIKNLLPEIVAVTRRLDIPTPSSFVPIAPNLTSLRKATRGVGSITKKVGDSTVVKQVTEVIKNNPNMQRQEFFDGLKISFADKLQIRRRTGSQKHMGFFDTDTDVFFINYDRWKSATRAQKGDILGDILAQQILHTSSFGLKKEISDRFTNYLDVVLRSLERKGALQGLRPEDLKSIRETIIGIPPLEDETTGELLSGVPRNLKFWMRNFNRVFKPVLQKVTDLPILSVDSLASPEAFFREWIRMYMTAPAKASVYPGFREILEKFLTPFVPKSLSSISTPLPNEEVFKNIIKFGGGKKGFEEALKGSTLFVVIPPKVKPAFGDSVQFAIETVMSASHSWDRTSIGAQALLAASREFGLKFDRRILREAAQWEGPISTILKDYRKNEKFLRLTLRAWYNFTQSFLKQRGISEVTIFRGMSWSKKATVPSWVKTGEFPRSNQVVLNPISFWSISKKFAGEFGGARFLQPDSFGVVLTITIPISQIVAMPFNSFAAAEGLTLTLGRPVTAFIERFSR